MPRLAPTPLQLISPEREQLQQLVNRHSTPQQIALRANIILLADEGQNHREIGRVLNISRGWVEGGYYSPPLPVRSGRETFAASSSRCS